MIEELRSGLLLFALLTSLSAVPVILRRLRPPTLALLHALGLVVVLALVLGALTGAGDARPLLVPYLVGLSLTAVGAAGPAGAAVVSRALRRLGLVVGLAGVLASGVSLAKVPLPFAVWLGLSLAAAAYGLAAAWSCRTRALRAETDAGRRAEGSAAIAAALASGAVVVALLVGERAGATWPLVLAVATALLTAVRVPPYAPPTTREGVSAVFVGLALFFSASARAAPADALLLGGEGALVALAVLAASRPLLFARGSARRRSPPQPVDEAHVPLVSEAALAHMTPLLDDGLLFRPSRPRVLARTTAKRLLDAALERAQKAQPPGRRAHLHVDVRDVDADLDVEGDGGELAEALCAVLDNALCLKNEHPGLSVRVHVRGSPGHVTFEVEDDLAAQLPDEEAPAPSDVAFGAARDGERPGLGVGLARAKLLVERHGGVLLTRRTAEGSCVQLTVPRRRPRVPFGLA